MFRYLDLDILYEPGGHVNPLQYSCLENPMDRGAWWATYSPWGGKESDMTEVTYHACMHAIRDWLT